jgi:hypothetical protein
VVVQLAVLLEVVQLTPPAQVQWSNCQVEGEGEFAMAVKLVVQTVDWPSVNVPPQAAIAPGTVAPGNVGGVV